MKTFSTSLCAVVLTTSFVSYAAPAHASTCEISTQTTKINAGRELNNGVPNYAQGTFEPGTGDCVATAIAMVLGYWDANNWSCMFPATGPYTGGSTPHASIKGAVDHFKINLDYTSPGGTSHSPSSAWAPEIAAYAQAQDSAAAAWSVHDDFWVSQGDVTSEIDASRPLVFNTLGVAGKQFTWNSPGGRQTGFKTLNHSMAALGYHRVVEGFEIFGTCVDWLDADEFYISLRSGWANGGNSEFFYHWGVFDTKTAVKVQPSGQASCSGGTMTPCAWTNDGECDEPEGLGYCDEGTDVADCTCQWQFDGECDESQGTGVCPEHSDAADC